MCIPLVARVLEVEADMAEVELPEGERVRANPVLHPDVGAGQYVLIDRGLIVEVIEAEQAESLLAFYGELEAMWEEEDAVHA